VWTRELFVRTSCQLIVCWLDGKQAAEQLVYRNISLDGNTLLVGAKLAKVHLGAHPTGDLRQVNSRFIFVTNLALHIDTLVDIYIIPKTLLK
jgi:hypothetical protein